jgi:hypothetical protein
MAKDTGESPLTFGADPGALAEAERIRLLQQSALDAMNAVGGGSTPPLNSDGNVYGGPDAAAEYMGLDDSYKNADGSWDFSQASRDAGERARAGETTGNLVFGGVGTATPPSVEDPWVDPNGGGGVKPDEWDGPTIGTVDPLDPFDPTTKPPERWTGAGDQADKSWKWDYFQPKNEGDSGWGGYDEDYNVFERYQPGADSPWGNPQGEGGNKEFYQQQFGNQLRDEQGYQSRERAAQQRRLRAISDDNQARRDGEGTYSPDFFSNMWESMGVTPNAVSGGDSNEGEGGSGFNPNYNLGKGSTNAEIIAGMGNIWTEGENQQWTDWSSASPEFGESQYWGSFDNPQDYMAAFTKNNPGVQANWTDINQKMANNLWSPAGGAMSGVPAGYASPI